MPTPSTWAVGVAAPSFTDPYAALEASVPGIGGAPFGPAGGESMVPPKRRLKGHVTEMLDWRGSPAIWVLAAILIAIGVLHLGGGFKVSGRAGPASASTSTDVEL